MHRIIEYQIIFPTCLTHIELINIFLPKNCEYIQKNAVQISEGVSIWRVRNTSDAPSRRAFFILRSLKNTTAICSE